MTHVTNANRDNKQTGRRAHTCTYTRPPPRLSGMWTYVTSQDIMKRRGEGDATKGLKLEWAQVRGRTADPWTSRICAGGWPETVRRWRHTWSRVYSPWSSCPPPPAEACTWRKSWKAERDRVYGNTNVVILTCSAEFMLIPFYVGFKPLLI